MSNAFLLFRSLVIYGVCLPLAIFIGYLLATPDIVSYTSVGIVIALMTIPLFLRWHYPWLIFSWNMIAGLFFLPGAPTFGMVMMYISFGISMLAYILNRNLKFISAPSLTRPMLAMAAVVFCTAQLTGGIGLNALGASMEGGKRYIVFFGGILGYFALTAHRIPLKKANLYVTLFFIGAGTAVIGDFFSLFGSTFSFMFVFFAPDVTMTSAGFDGPPGIVRLSGVAAACTGGIAVLLAVYGMEGVLSMRKNWRLFLFVVFTVGVLFGGYRSRLIDLLVISAILFFMEGMHRSRWMPIMLLAGLLGISCVITLADKLPLSVQRAMTFLPSSVVTLDQDVEQNAKGSTDWRLEIWRNVLPTIPQYLILGKGLAIDHNELEMTTGSFNKGGDSIQGATLAGDYHSGPLSLIIQFGLPGVFVFFWFLIAGYRALHRNYLYGIPELKNINRFFLVAYCAKILAFFFIFGSFYSDAAIFTAYLGLSVALNGGVHGTVREPVRPRVFSRFKLAPAAPGLHR